VAVTLLRLGEPGPRLAWRALVGGMSWLAVAWVTALTVANLGPVIVTAMLPGEPGRAGTFAFVFVLVRVPLFVLLALQPLLLPLLTHAAASHDVPGLRRGIRQALLLVGALGIAVLVAAAPVGGWLVHALFRGAPAPSAATMTLLAAGTVLAILVQVLQPALLAVASHRVVAVAWAAGGAGFAVAFLLPVDPISAGTTAQLAAGLLTATIMAVALHRRLTGAWRTGTAAHAQPPAQPSL
jgi:O-antigen/teichoic acid export membrane protein